MSAIAGSGLLIAATARASAPDAGGRIVFTSNATGDYDIYSMNARGGDRVVLTQSPIGDFHAQWSPDGTKIAFERFNSDNGADIWTMNADGSHQVQLTHGPGLNAQPAWSPDGKRIAFFRDQGDGENLYTMKTNGTDQRQLTNLADGRRSPGTHRMEPG